MKYVRLIYIALALTLTNCADNFMFYKQAYSCVVAGVAACVCTGSKTTKIEVMQCVDEFDNDMYEGLTCNQDVDCE